jgi:hypothetical protein
MTFKEMCNNIREAIIVFDKMQPDIISFVNDTKMFLVVDYPRNHHIAEKYNQVISQISDIKAFTNNDELILGKFKWLGKTNCVSSFTVEVRFDTLNMPLIRALRNHPLISDIECQKNWSEASIQVLIYIYKGAFNGFNMR